MPGKPHTILKQYGRSSLNLVQLLKGRIALTGEEQTFIHNHLVIVQLAVAVSKYRQAKHEIRADADRTKKPRQRSVPTPETAAPQPLK